MSFGSFYSGIFRPKEMTGPATLSLVTAAPKEGRPAPYEDALDEQTGRFTYRFRDPQGPSSAAARGAEADNRALLAAHDLGVPMIYFRGIAPGQSGIVAPVFVMAVDRVARAVEMEAALPLADMTPAGLVSDEEVRRYATREALFRLHQHRFRAAVLRAYATRCAVCRLREAALLQAAHIVEDRDPGGAATIVNGIALCAIHHLARIAGASPALAIAGSRSASRRSDDVLAGLRGLLDRGRLDVDRLWDREEQAAVRHRTRHPIVRVAGHRAWSSSDPASFGTPCARMHLATASACAMAAADGVSSDAT